MSNADLDTSVEEESFATILAAVAAIRDRLSGPLPEAERAQLEAANGALTNALGEIALRDFERAADAVAAASARLSGAMQEQSDTLGDLVTPLRLLIGSAAGVPLPRMALAGRPAVTAAAAAASRTDMNEAGYKLLRDWEGCILFAYDDADDRRVRPGQPIAGTLTIGYGHTGADVAPGMVWTQAQAEAALHADVRDTVHTIAPLIKRPLGDNQFAAFVCFAFNIGSPTFATSSALRFANEGRLAEVPARMALYHKTRIKGVLVDSPGLANRRAAEIALWSKP